MDLTEQKILNSYLGLIQSLEPTMKVNLLEQLNKSVKETDKQKSLLDEAFGSWHSNESAEELIEMIQSNRNTNRQIEEL